MARGLFVKLDDWRLDDVLVGRVSKAALVTYLVLRTWGRNKPKAWPSNRSIATRRAIAPVKVQGHLKMLEMAGWITRAGGRRRVIRFPVDPPEDHQTGGPLFGDGHQNGGDKDHQNGGVGHPQNGGHTQEPDELEPDEGNQMKTSSGVGTPEVDGQEEFKTLWASWRTAGGRLRTPKAQAYARWQEALRHKDHQDDCVGRGRCKCPLECQGPADLLQRGLDNLAHFEGTQYIADLGGWLNPKSPKGARFARAVLGPQLEERYDDGPPPVPSEPMGEPW